MKPLFEKLKKENRLNILLLFVITTAFCITLVAFRVRVTSTVTFVFLVWNIILAVIPYGISTLLFLYHERISNRWIIFLPFILWLCFFPNAPYILTDLFHLRPRAGVPFWYDLALILFFAWNGLMLGYASLMDIQAVVTYRFNTYVGWAISVGSLILGSFGIYLGRYLRWNSWDVISSPGRLLEDVAERLLHPSAHPTTYGVTIIFSIFLVLGYLLIFHFIHAYRKSIHASSSPLLL